MTEQKPDLLAFREGLPEGPWSIDNGDNGYLGHVSRVTAADGTGIALCLDEEFAKRIAAIPSMLAEIERLRGEVTDIQAKLDGWKIAERMISAAYVRLRRIIPGALDTPDAPSPEQVWVTTESAAERLRALNAELLPALEDCANDLEAELQHRYRDMLGYASNARKFELDMAPVRKARAILSKATGDETQ